LAWVFPRFFRDFIYRIIAKNRYRWFGKHTQCALPTAEQRERFIG
jgi:predicted DCC family thiol-disulfide oxidoreductase YuxK